MLRIAYAYEIHRIRTRI